MQDCMPAMTLPPYGMSYLIASFAVSGEVIYILLLRTIQVLIQDFRDCPYDVGLGFSLALTYTRCSGFFFYGLPLTFWYP